jgi:hypothetical protein
MSGAVLLLHPYALNGVDRDNCIFRWPEGIRIKIKFLLSYVSLSIRCSCVVAFIFFFYVFIHFLSFYSYCVTRSVLSFVAFYNFVLQDRFSLLLIFSSNFCSFLVLLNHSSQISRDATHVGFRKYKYEASSSVVLLLQSITKIDDSRSLKAEIGTRTEEKNN